MHCIAGHVIVSAADMVYNIAMRMCCKWQTALCEHNKQNDSRGYTLQVIVAGTAQQVQDALEGAEEFKEALQERGVLVVPLPIFANTNAEKDEQMQLTEGDLR